MTDKALEAARYASGRLASLADPARGEAVARYVKTTMPCLGVPAPERRIIERELRERFTPSDDREYSSLVQTFWSLPHREEKYIAIACAGMFKPHIKPSMLGLYGKLIREGAWWDLVDGVVSLCISPLLLKNRSVVAPSMEEWIDDPSLWIRRSAILCQLKHGRDTDVEMLFRFCLGSAGEKEFFIRKAIGWALREYSYTNPEAVAAFLSEHRDRLSGLSLREGSKELRRRGIDPLAL